MTCQGCDYDYDYRDSCVDAWELERYYNCYESSHPVIDCGLITVGDMVEFNVEKERMWGKIINKCEGCSLCCDFVIEVTSDLLLSHSFSKGDRLLLSLNCVYNHEIAEENLPEENTPPCKSPYTIPCS